MIILIDDEERGKPRSTMIGAPDVEKAERSAVMEDPEDAR